MVETNPESKRIISPTPEELEALKRNADKGQYAGRKGHSKSSGKQFSRTRVIDLNRGDIKRYLTPFLPRLYPSKWLGVLPQVDISDRPTIGDIIALKRESSLPSPASSADKSQKPQKPQLQSHK